MDELYAGSKAAREILIAVQCLGIAVLFAGGVAFVTAFAERWKNSKRKEQ